MAAAAPGPSVSHTNPSSRFLQSRINALSATLAKRFQNILQTAYDDEEDPAHSYVDIATEQFQVDVETQALIRAAEEIMILTRSMKEMWLFGGLNTVKEGGQQDDGVDEEEVKQVREGLNKWLQQKIERMSDEIKKESEETQNG